MRLTELSVLQNNRSNCREAALVPLGLLGVGMLLMALRNVLILRRLPTGPALGRPEDRLRGRLEGRTALVPP